MELNGVMLGSEDPAKLEEFYAKAFGKTTWADPENGWYGHAVGSSGIMIGPHSDVKGKSKEPARMMMIIESKDVAGDFEKLKSAGGEVVAAPYNPDKEQPKVWLATVADTDGNYLQLSTPWKDVEGEIKV